MSTLCHSHRAKWWIYYHTRFLRVFILYVYYGYTCIAKLENQVDWPILRSHSSCVMSEIHAELELLWMELAPTDLHHAEEAKRKWNSARGIVKVRESGERKFRPGDISELGRSDLKYPIMFWKFGEKLILFKIFVRWYSNTFIYLWKVRNVFFTRFCKSSCF